LGDRIAIGVDVGGTKILAVIYSEREGILLEEQISADRYATPEVTLTEVASLIRNIMERAGVTTEGIAGVGVGVPGLVSPERIFIDSIILPTWVSVNVGLWLSEALRVRVIVDNDATMAAIGQWSLYPRSSVRTLLCLTLGTGVGAAAIVNDKVLRGPDGTAGQLGHITVDLSGRHCSCGSTGCLNAYVSGTAIGERYLEHLARSNTAVAITDTAVSGRYVSNAAQEGDAVALEVIEETSLYLGAGLASLVNIFNPDIIVICGGVSELGESLLGPARIVMNGRAFRSPARRVRVDPGRFGYATGAVGAAIAVWSHM